MADSLRDSVLDDRKQEHCLIAEIFKTPISEYIRASSSVSKKGLEEALVQIFAVVCSHFGISHTDIAEMIDKRSGVIKDRATIGRYIVNRLNPLLSDKGTLLFVTPVDIEPTLVVPLKVIVEATSAHTA